MAALTPPMAGRGDDIIDLSGGTGTAGFGYGGDDADTLTGSDIGNSGDGLYGGAGDDAISVRPAVTGSWAVPATIR